MEFPSESIQTKKETLKVKLSLNFADYMESRRHELHRITLKKMQNARGLTEQCMICLELSHNQRSTNGQNTYQSCCMFTMLHLIHLQHSPHFLMFGQGARLPIDLLLRGDEEVDENQSDWLAEHQARLTDAYQRAEEHLKQQAEKRQDQHLEREYNIPIQKGQLVYLRNQVRGRNKIQDAWDSILYKVVDVPRDNFVSFYTVEPVDCPGEIKKVHQGSLRISSQSKQGTERP